MGYRTRLLTATAVTAVGIYLSPTAFAQTTTNVESVVVTGSRITTGDNAPTPVTVLDPNTLAATTPSNLPQALEKLPEFMGSANLNFRSFGGANISGAALNLRNFGVNRNLILLDGYRVAPNYANGAVNTDIIPEMLVDRVDVVTGGASAVYGSDAVSGVVNFILDKKFDGLKVEANAGINNNGLAPRYQVGVAYGTDLFGGRGHFEITARGFKQNQVLIKDLPYGTNGQAYAYAGNGTAASPYTLINEARLNTQPITGLISCGGCAANGLTFVQNGVLGPLDKGTVTSAGSPNLSNGGQGRVDGYSAAQTGLKNGQVFGRFSYDLNNDLTFWTQARYSAAEYRNNGPTNGIPPGSFTSSAARPNIFFTDNPYLSPQTQALLNQGNTNTITDFNGVVHHYFTYVNYQSDLSGSANPALAATGQQAIFTYLNKDQSASAALGLDGKVGSFDFSASYSHTDNLAQSTNPANTNFQNEYAASDAVQLASGQIVCYVSTTANASLYPGCVPANPFGVNSLTRDQYAYYSGNRTTFSMTNRLDDLQASVTGTLFELPAGPLKVALSGDARWAEYKILSNAQPVNVSCGTNVLRICSNSTILWFQTTLASLAPVTQNVQEAALEFNVPVLKDVPLIQSLSFDLAGRYTNYSTSGGAETWKVGLDYHVNDSIRFRGAASADIRAPTLNDLFAPAGQGTTSLADLLTGKSADTVQVTKGNPNLKPETALTYTGGVVLTPSFAPRLSLSVDYYKITLKNAITSIAYNTTAIQQICLSAIAAGTGASSPYCALAVRPNPLSDTSQANFPTSIITQSLNSAVQRTEGVDFELNYEVPVDEIGLPGSLHFRSLFSYQPYLVNVAFPGATATITPQPKGRLNTFLTYAVDDRTTVSVQDRWLSDWDQATFKGQHFAPQRVHSYNQVDVTLDYAIESDFHAYLTVEDLFNTKYPISPLTTSGANPGIQYPVPAAFGQVLNQNFTVGLRKTF